MKTQAWTVGIIGIAVALASLLGFGHATYQWIDLIAGAVVAVIALSVVDRQPTAWVTAFLGLWLFVAGFIGALHAGSWLLWGNILTGALILATSYLIGSKAEPAHPATAH